jgi:hypothetical protein
LGTDLVLPNGQPGSGDIRLGIVRGISYGQFGNTDAFGHRRPVEWREGRLQAQVSVTPMFISAD